MHFTNQVVSIADVTNAMVGGDLKLKETVSEMTENLADEGTSVGRELGTEGRLGG
jgi:hypothetical protein